MHSNDMGYSLVQIIKKGLDCFRGNVMFTDNKGNILFANEYLCNLYKIPYEEVLTMNAEDFISRGILDRSAAVEALKTQKQVIRRLKTNRGEELDSVGYPVFDENGKLLAVAAYSYDGTFIKELMQEINSERLKNETMKSALRHYISENGKTEYIVASPAMKALFASCEIIAQLDNTIFITGESGTGKEVMANFIHKNSTRSNEIFMPVNCSTIPKELMEAEFFGYEKGAFTGADKNGKMGLFQVADRGTLFLDEISELPLPLQAKLLRVLENGEIKKVGGSKRIFTDVRIIAATNKNLEELIEKKEFREDLYYRLNVIPIKIPPLRERKEDIEVIALHFCDKFNQKYNAALVISSNIIEDLKSYSWPGNVRQLRNEIERMVIYNKTGDALIPLKEEIPKSQSRQDNLKPDNENIFNPQETSSLKAALREYEHFLINQALIQSGGNVQKAAKLLGIERSGIYKKLKNNSGNCKFNSFSP